MTTRIFLILLLLTSPAAFAAVERSALEETIYRVTLGKPADVEVMVKKLGNPNAVDSMGYTLLSIAASRNDAEALNVVKKLIELGADVNYHPGNKNFPIMAAVQSGNADIVRYLLDQGANYRAQDAYGMKLIDFARQSGDAEIARMIEDAVQSDILALATSRTQAFLDETTYNLAYHACAEQYFAFYYGSRQDDIPETKQQQVLKSHNDIVKRSISNLVSVFRVNKMEFSEVYNAGRGAIKAELEGLISNRWRRQKGVGQPGDMEKRCQPIAEPYREGVFDKSELDRRVR